MEDVSPSDKEPQTPSDAPAKEKTTGSRGPLIIVGTVAAVVVALSAFYLLRPVPLLVQGEVDATRLDIAALASNNLRMRSLPHR